MSAHTPGPWRLSGRNVLAESTGQVVAQAHWPVIPGDLTGGPPSRPELEANARLIAAAPDLLAALQTMVSVVGAQDASGPDDGSLVALAMAHDAIAKAVTP